MKRRPPLRTILLALLLATIAAFVVAWGLGRRQPPPRPVAAEPTPAGVPVLVAAKAIAKGEPLVAAAVALDAVPETARDPEALTDPAQAVGKIAAADLVAGSQIRATQVRDLPPTPSTTFAENVPPGMRAVSIPITEPLNAGGLIQPGDHVDVIASTDKVELKYGPAAATKLLGLPDDRTPEVGPLAGLLVQDVEVLAVAQALTPDDQSAAGAADKASSTAEADLPGSEPQPVARPDAKSVTLLVSVEDALRLTAADQAEMGLHLALRAPGDATLSDLRPVQTGGDMTLPRLPGDLGEPIAPADLRIVDARFRETNLPAGGLLEFQATVKNVSQQTIRSGQALPPGTRYEPGQTFAADGADASGNVRIGLTLDGAQLPAFPFRWDLGGDLAPGQTRMIRGAAHVPNQPGELRYWLGVIDGDGRVVQDGVAPTSVSIAPATRVQVVGPIARVFAERWAGAKVVATLPHGATATVIDYRDGWFLVR
ncbi:MAG TPA: Flp pilus assembly protein CpaB, partial [Thermomicrobiales bacterium]|nr:Flp pilus assembly protein CpaB [Thermomicrobiales bacterium]